MKYIFIILLITGCSSGNNSQETETVIIDSISSPLLEITYLLGGGRFQDFAIDDKIYVLSDNGGDSTINTFNHGHSPQDSQGSFTYDFIGHQGLSYYKGFWSTYRPEKRSMVYFNEYGLKAVLRLFGDDFSSRSSCTPSVTKDYTAAFGYRSGLNIVRVWYTSLEAGDYTDKYLHEWEGPTTAPAQGLQIIGDKLWIITGGKNRDKDKHLYQYTLKGQLISDEIITVGKTAKGIYEPEGLGVLDGRLILGILTDLPRLY